MASVLRCLASQMLVWKEVNQRREKRSGVILTYHEIVDTEASYIYSVSVASLKSQLGLVRDIASKDRNQPCRLSITFDDGHISHYRSALPLLQELGISATFCVTAGWTDREPNYMTRTHLRELLTLGHQIYAHGWTHRMLTRCTPSELHQELWGAKRFLEDVLGAPVSGVSVPHGRWNDRVLKTCAEIGYSTVHISEPHVGPIVRCGVCLAGRYMVTRKSSRRSLEALASGRANSRSFGTLLQGTKRAVRIVIGEDAYRKVWRRLGDKTQDLPGSASTNPSLKVLQLISSGGYYGAESMLLNLTKALVDDNVDTVVGVFSNTQNPHTEVADRAKREGLKTRVIPCRGRLDWHAVRQIRDLLYAHGIDVVHAHGSKANVYSALAVLGLPVPLVATYHIDWPDRGHLLRFYHLLDRIVLQRFTRIVAVSAPIERSLLAAGIRGKRISTIKNGIDLEPLVHSGHEQRRQREPRVIGVVGRLTPQKGHRFLLEAAPEILLQYPNLSFLFVGDGPELENLRQQVGALKLERHVTFAGSREDMPGVYASLDILVLPSLNEGMPMTLIEALAAALPVIATAVGDVPKLIANGQTGVLVEAGKPGALKDALVSLLSDGEKRLAIALEGQRVVLKDYSASGMAGQYLRLYSQMMTQNAVPETSLELR